MHRWKICTDKDETIVQYTVLKGNEQLFASKYRTLLPTEAELIAELERERRVIAEKWNGGDTGLVTIFRSAFWVLSFAF